MLGLTQKRVDDRTHGKPDAYIVYCTGVLKQVRHELHVYPDIQQTIPMQIKREKFRSKLQLTLVISTSLISNNRLSRTENLVPAYT